MSDFNWNDYNKPYANPGVTMISAYKAQVAENKAAADAKVKAQQDAETHVADLAKKNADTGKVVGDTRKINVEADGTLAGEVAPFAHNFIQLPDAESRTSYVRTNRPLLLSKGVLPEVLDAIEANPMDPSIQSTMQAYADYGYTQKDRAADNKGVTVSDGTALRNPMTGALLAAPSYKLDHVSTQNADGSSRTDVFNPDPASGGYTGGATPAPNAQAPAPVEAAPVDPNAQGTTLGAIVHNETPTGSDYDANGNLYRSRKGAMGKMQVMPATARDPGFGIRPWDGHSTADLERVGVEYHAAMQKKFNGDPIKVLAAYNAGPGRVDGLVARYGDNWAAHLPHETRKYIADGTRYMGGVGGEGTRSASLAPVAPPADAPDVTVTGTRQHAWGVQGDHTPAPSKAVTWTPDGNGGLIGSNGDHKLDRTDPRNAKPDKPVKAWPPTTVAAYSDNVSTLRTIDNALALLDPRNNSAPALAAKKAFGLKNYAASKIPGGQYAMGTLDSSGNPIRTLVGEVSSRTLKDMSGSAVTVPEEYRGQNWIPDFNSDTAERAFGKLTAYRRRVAEMNSQITQNYNSQTGYRDISEAPAKPHAATGNTGGHNAVLDRARAAIAQGAPRAVVIERLRKAGIDPKGL